jgi:DNA-binding NtrC family response regulator
MSTAEATPPSVTPEESTIELLSAAENGPFIIEAGDEQSSASRTLQRGERLVLGSGSSADLLLADRTVSARHCVLQASERGVHLQDLQSKNGTFVGSARVREALLTGTSGLFVIGRTVVTVRRANDDDDVGSDAAIPGLVGRSAPMRRVAAEVRRHAPLRAPVLLQGESGTGKDVVARALHGLSRRVGPYVPLNVGTIPEALADAELFGHRRGAFTGAVAARCGAFEQANNGSLFLDEIAELPPSIQVRLLRVVEDGMVRPVGASQMTKVDVRIISASWASLEQRIGEGRFREDLFHRLSTVVIQLPPLRQRKSDIPALATALLIRFRNELGEKTLATAALARLVAHDWPGNVRELGSVLYRAAVASDGARIEPQHLQIGAGSRVAGVAAPITPREAAVLLEKHGGNVSAAARAARVARSTFRSWLEKAPLCAASHLAVADVRSR